MALVLEGEAGIGKTTVWSEALRRAESRGLPVIFCRASQRETTDVALLDAEVRDATDQRTIAVALLSTLRALAVSSPVLVAVDGCGGGAEARI